MLWINDLSRPDTLFHLPFRLPFLGTTAVNILPILMIISWVMQGKLAPQTAAMDERARQQQKMMTFVLPVIFGIFCYSFPSGVVLYWLAVTASSGVEQYLIRKKLVEEDEPLPPKGSGRRKKPDKKRRRS
jgi:YidC/Oxa1 family membrane protein insertase